MKTKKENQLKEQKLTLFGSGACKRCSCTGFSPSDDDSDVCDCGHMITDHKKSKNNGITNF